MARFDSIDVPAERFRQNMEIGGSRSGWNGQHIDLGERRIVELNSTLSKLRETLIATESKLPPHLIDDAVKDRLVPFKAESAAQLATPIKRTNSDREEQERAISKLIEAGRRLSRALRGDKETR